MILSSAEDVVVTYGQRRVLDGLDLAIEAADQCAVTGRSGSGKTTLLLLMAGLVRATSGRVTLAVQPHEVVYVPQAASLIPELTARDNAVLGLRFRGVDPGHANELATEVLEKLGLAEALDALPGELSGGMQQRVAIARAVVVAPRLLLADEPTGTLDRRSGEQVLTVLRDLAAQRDTALVVATHDPEIAALFPRQLALVDGQLA
ncbi:MAG: lipoprotein releasing system ATP-binding protein LolD [Frankiales bacterium]|jgi:ABC-type lipoprotein export system ATPase subunit|nr:lipoprotein releasing system ATP-binding protein LolD [Frankiales bacterium]